MKTWADFVKFLSEIKGIIPIVNGTKNKDGKITILKFGKTEFNFTDSAVVTVKKSNGETVSYKTEGNVPFVMIIKHNREVFMNNLSTDIDRMIELVDMHNGVYEYRTATGSGRITFGSRKRIDSMGALMSSMTISLDAGEKHYNLTDEELDMVKAQLGYQIRQLAKKAVMANQKQISK